jgi:predicted dehydrogenase
MPRTGGGIATRAAGVSDDTGEGESGERQMAEQPLPRAARHTARPIRLGIIGTGLALERLHWPALRQLPEQYTITAFAETSPEQAAHFAAYTGVGIGAHHQRYADLLRRGDVDAVLIALPISLLYAAAREALLAGKDVICEKPAGTDEAQGRAFLALAEEFPGRTIMIAENYFYRDDLRLARSLLDAGAIGRVHLVSWRTVARLIPLPGQFSGTPWRRRTAYRGGPHLDNGVHHIAQLRLLCGDVRRLSAETQSANSTLDAPSDLTIALRFAAGAAGHYTASYPEIAVPDEPNELRIYGTAGALILDQDRHEYRVTHRRADGPTAIHRFSGIDNGYYNEFRNFYDAVTHGEPLVGTIAQSFANLLTVMRALDAAECATTQTLDDLPSGPEAPGVPLWRPRGACGLFEGLPGCHACEVTA